MDRKPVGATVECAMCGMPGRVIFNADGTLKNAFFVCDCPRPTVHDVNERLKPDGA